MHGVRPAQRPRRCLGQAEIAHLAGLDQIGHGADGVLDRHVRIDPVLIEEVDVVDPEPRQRAVTRFAHMLRPAVGALDPPLRVDGEAELGGEDDIVAASLDGAPDQPFVLERPVDLGRVEEGDAELDRPVDGCDRLRLIGDAVGPAHTHAA